MRNSLGFTLIEVLIATAVLVVGVAGVFATLGYFMGNLEVSQDMTIGLRLAELKAEEIVSLGYTDIKSSYTNGGAWRQEPFIVNGVDINTGTASGLGTNSSGTVYAQEIAEGTYPDDLIRLKIVICWQSKLRYYGEDRDWDGQLDLGLAEDANGNSELDSPCEIETVVVRK